MRDEVLKRMAKYLCDNIDGDELLSDIENKKMIDMETVQKDPEAFKSFMKDVLAWSNESKRGLLCGIFGCRNDPAFVCKICGSSYCDRCKEHHFHSANNDGLIRDEAFEK